MPTPLTTAQLRDAAAKLPRVSLAHLPTPFEEIARFAASRYFDLRLRFPAPVVPRNLRIEVGGRLRADGSEQAPLALDDRTAAALARSRRIAGNPDRNRLTMRQSGFRNHLEVNPDRTRSMSSTPLRI